MKDYPMLGEAGPDVIHSVAIAVPGGGTMRVAVVPTVSSDSLRSVAAKGPLDFDDALAAVGRIAEALRNRLDAMAPSKATVEFGVGFSVEAGKLTSLLVGGKGEATLKVTLEWDRAARVSPGAEQARANV